VGGPTAEKIIATLRRKVTRFALMPSPRAPSSEAGAAAEEVPVVAVEGNLLEDVYQALVSIGHGPVEARNLLDKVLASGKTFDSVEDVLQEIYRNK
jgi:Holliday junction DNA helicase RuvA